MGLKLGSICSIPVSGSVIFSLPMPSIIFVVTWSATPAQMSTILL
jgi:hypothetical protein